MSDRYLSNIIKKNFKIILIFILVILLIGFVIKNIGEIPYEDQHLMNTTTPVQFEIKGNEIRGFIYLSYWVQADSNKTNQMNSTEFGNFLLENGYIDLRKYKDSLITTLKTYNPDQIKESWMNDYQFFKKRNVYFIDNDNKLMNTMKKQEIDINLNYHLKKIFFVYLDKEKYNEFIKSLE
ncbi:MAG: hypothetical protein K9K32_00365 [Halanaerobiales bacterium]|nr:hypothetical protein [Halanaerobiales bacterium]